MTAGAYGFRIAGGSSDRWLAVYGAERWPLLTLQRDARVARDDLAHVDTARMRADVSAALPEDEIVHPVLSRMVARLAGPRGIDAIHGGALVGSGGAWVVTGAKEAGKSTLLARCASEGACVLSDDVVAFEGTRCMAGPRCIDLRETSARLFGGGVPVREMTRWRVTLAPAPAEVELAGFVYLAWGPEIHLVPLAPAERLARLAVRRAEEKWPRDPAFVLDLAVRPAFVLRRPHGLGSLERSAALLLDAAGVQAARATA